MVDKRDDISNGKVRRREQLKNEEANNLACGNAKVAVVFPWFYPVVLPSYRW